MVEAIDAGHFQRTVDITLAKKYGWKAGEVRCRADDHLFPCPAILAARREQSKVSQASVLART